MIIKENVQTAVNQQLQTKIKQPGGGGVVHKKRGGTCSQLALNIKEEAPVGSWLPDSNPSVS